MPAVTADTLTLPKLARPEPGATERAVELVTTAPIGLEGEGFPVHRAFAGVPIDRLDPFVHMDQMGAVDYAPGEPKGTSWHPHRGFETVTYMMDGTFAHQDSHGGGGVITDGATQWMTAGGGILHIETPPEALVISGGLFHGIQLWVNLPRAKKWSSPRYQDIRAGQVGLLASHDAGALFRVIAGELDGHNGPGITHTPMTMTHVSIEPGQQAVIPWPRSHNALAYVLAGRGLAGEERRPAAMGQLVAFGGGDTVVLSADPVQDSRSSRLEVLVLGGEPIREPVAWYGPFVMNTREELQAAFDDYRAGRMGSIPATAVQR